MLEPTLKEKGLSPQTYFLVTLETDVILEVCLRPCFVGGQHHDYQWVGYVAFSTTSTWDKIWYSTYAPAADWRYAGIQLLFITPKRGFLIFPDRISLHDISAPAPLRARAHTADSFIICSTENR